MRNPEKSGIEQGDSRPPGHFETFDRSNCAPDSGPAWDFLYILSNA
jgi:hypothetical protein